MLVIIYLSTNPLVDCLYIAKQTGSLVLSRLIIVNAPKFTVPADQHRDTNSGFRHLVASNGLTLYHSSAECFNDVKAAIQRFNRALRLD